MKQTKLLSAIILLTLSSCYSRGDYNCVCAGDLTSSYHQEMEVPGSSKKDARAKCQAMSIGKPTGVTCDLKTK